MVPLASSPRGANPRRRGDGTDLTSRTVGENSARFADKQTAVAAVDERSLEVVDLSISDGGLTDDELSLPPIQTAITLQPLALLDSIRNPSSRRPIPVSTLGWLTAGPRSQLSVFSGLYLLQGVEQLEVQRVVDMSTRESPYNSQYRVRVPRAETIFLAVEEQPPASSRSAVALAHQCTHALASTTSRPLVVNLYDSAGECALVFRKSLGFGMVPGLLHRLSVEAAEPIGSVEQSFSLFGYSFTIYDDSRKVLCRIRGPSSLYACCRAGHQSHHHQFQIVAGDESRQVASLIRHWDQVLMDYSLLLTFSPETDAKLKGLLLAATFLLEFLYFEHLPRRPS